MTLDISMIPVEFFSLHLLREMVEANDVDLLRISKDQARQVLTSDGEKWTHYGDIPIEVVKSNSNRVELAIPEKDLTIMTIDGYKFLGDGNSFQCATCLNIMGVQPDDDTAQAAKEEKRVRRIKLIKGCDCPRQEEAK